MFWQSARFEAKSCFWLKTEEAYDQQKKLMASKKTINMDRGSGVSQLYLQLYSWKCWKSEIFVLFFRESFQNNLSLHSYLIRCRLGLVGRQSSCFLTKQNRCLSWQHSQQTALNHKRTRGKLQKRLWCCFCLAQPVPSLPCGRFKQSLKMLPGKTSILFKKIKKAAFVRWSGPFYRGKVVECERIKFQQWRCHVPRKRYKGKRCPKESPTVHKFHVNFTCLPLVIPKYQL